ncbi:uncharacterized protein LOC6641398 isoform X2 [Drosophila willistoni]|uniref:uncharacterized protein LOC6641398 isoform X2 n=1 Tax=Drosophila willistoni TaxID=7260 RepID=UPI000C26C9B7|nr:uncharacterized protein LOC6641398 isoform X2 [Drosophila willistoni]
MEKKFCSLEQKATEGLQAFDEGIQSVDPRGRTPGHLEVKKDDRQNRRGTELEKKVAETNLAVVLSPTSLRRQEQGGVSHKGVFGDVASNYFKLAQSIECRQCLPRSGGSRASGGGGGCDEGGEQALTRHSQGENQLNTSIGLVDLYRLRLQYEKLGIPLTALELFSMARYERPRDLNMGIEDKLPPQSQLPSPLPAVQEEQQQEPELELEQEQEQEQDLELEKELAVDNDSSLGELRLKDAMEQRRLPGGYRRANGLECIEISSTPLSKVQKEMYSCGQELYEQQVPRDGSHYSTNQYYDAEQKMKYNSNEDRQMQLSTVQKEGAYRSYDLPRKFPTMLPNASDNCPTTAPDANQYAPSAPIEQPVRKYQRRFQPSYDMYETKLTQDAFQSGPSMSQKQYIYKTEQDCQIPMQSEPMMDYRYRQTAHTNRPMHGQYEPCVQDGRYDICYSPPPPLALQLRRPRREGLRPEILQHIKDVDRKMLPQPPPRSFDLRRGKIECNLAERLQQQQQQEQEQQKLKQSILSSAAVQQDQHQDMQQKFKKQRPQADDSAALIKGDLQTWLPHSQQNQLAGSDNEEEEQVAEVKREVIAVPPQPVSSSSFDSPFNLQPDRLNALLNARPRKSCLKNSMNKHDPTEELTNENHDYEADHETQSDDDTSSDSTADGNPLTEKSSTDTLTNVWYRLDETQKQQKKKQKAAMKRGKAAALPAPRLTGGMYSDVDKLKFKPIDKLEAGSPGSPILDEEDSHLASERMAYFARKSAKLTRKERAQDIELRMGQLRLLQATSDRKYRRILKANGFLEWQQLSAVAIDSMRYCCPLAHNGVTPCPLLLNESLLEHFIKSHLDVPGLELCEIFERDRLLIIFNPFTFELGKNFCMSAIVYGGFRDSPYSLPLMRFMPIYNVNLSDTHGKYACHLPLFLLICRTRLSAIDDDPPITTTMRTRHMGRQPVDEDVLALWVVSMELPQPIHVTISLFNRRLDVTRSAIMKVRALKESQNCADFMRTSENYMRLTEQDMQILTNNNKESIYMELSVREYGATVRAEVVSALK